MGVGYYACELCGDIVCDCADDSDLIEFEGVVCEWVHGRCVSQMLASGEIEKCKPSDEDFEVAYRYTDEGREKKIEGLRDSIRRLRHNHPADLSDVTLGEFILQAQKVNAGLAQINLKDGEDRVTAMVLAVMETGLIDAVAKAIKDYDRQE